MEALQQIQLFETLFYVFLAIAVIGLGLAVFFFFFFDIRSIRALMTGKAKQQTIERMAEQNSRTGRLQQQIPLSEKFGNTGPVIQHPAPAAMADTAPLDGMGETSVLQPQTAETSVLNAPVGETSVLGGAMGETAVLSAQQQAYTPSIRFDVTENTLVIHTTQIL